MNTNPTSCSCLNCHLKGLFFDNIDTDKLELFCSAKVERDYKKGETIVQEGELIKDFIYLKSGLVKLTRKISDNGEQILSFAKPFDFVSLLSVFSSERHRYSVTVLEDTSICVLNLNDIITSISNNGKFGLSIMRKISDATDKILLDNLEIKRKHLIGRVAHVLIYFSDMVYENKTFELPVSRKEIADYIGMTTENVIRTLSEFKKDGIIRTYGKDIDIIDYDRLLAISLHG